MRTFRVSIFLLVLYSTGAIADSDSLSFRLDPASGNVIAVISGYLPLCGGHVLGPLVATQAGTTITIMAGPFPGIGGCVPPPGYQGPYYELTVSLGHLSAPLYTVSWFYSDAPQFPLQTVQLVPESLAPYAIPALSAINMLCLSLLLAPVGFFARRCCILPQASR